ncbi:hypothetical protein BZA05DRAFT_398628 [Tricharina praecox]|uniref:uncharacterized protein n=1 Tax=Tricharina praecox TaxID=43433 RepID=UPI00221F37FB|nr:uncharacterized protein BZA05DRAFT_398628 [Tricharina praecox]KAI5852004.1 hypothetical protein BZA05DRAFT_398628 [Tricharina praecox]
MRPPTAFARAPICTLCTLRALPRLRPAPRLQPTPYRAFRTSPHLLKKAVTSSTAAAPAQSPYATSTNSLNSLVSAVDSRILSSSIPPPEEEILAALAALQSYARQQLHVPPSATTRGASPASALLSLSGKPPSPPAVRKISEPSSDTPTLAQKGQFTELSSLAYRLLSHPTVFLTPEILRAFTDLQRITRDAAPIPAVFALYANKPILPPSGKGAPKTPNPRQAKYAIPDHVVVTGLETAIDAGDITAALDIIDTSYGAPAYRRAKFVRRVLPVVSVAALAPGALWVLADRLAGWQDTVEHDVAMRYAFGGFIVYVGLTTGFGLLAVGTANDQMVRVSWVPGTPLRERWFREEERAALDAVAMAWGFQEKHKHGFEEGEEWELLREVVGRKGMMLDNPTLMEGME